jgi:autotransporter-associated beta strand protein
MFYQSATGGGAGLINLNAANTYTGDSTFNTQSSTGHIIWGTNNALPVTTNVMVGLASGAFGSGALDLHGFNQTVNSLKTGSGVTGAASAGITNQAANLSTLTITGNQTTTYSSTIGSPLAPGITGISGPDLDNIAVVLSNTHTGSLELTRTSFYHGGTTVNGGTLLSNSNPAEGSATGQGPVIVNAAGTLGGTGRIAGPVTLNSTAHFNPGGLAVAEDIQLDNNLTLASGNIFNYDFAPTLQDKIVVSGNVALPASGDIDFNLNDLGGLVTGDYDLITYGGALSGDFSTLSIGTAPGGSTYTLVNAPGAIRLHVVGTANSRTWSGSVNGNWDVNTTANWAGGNKFVNGDLVTFDDSGANTTITIAAGGVAPGTTTFSNNGVGYTFNGGSIGGTGSLNKLGSGTVTLNNTNTFTGGVNLGGGTLAISSGNAIGGASAINFTNNAILQANGAVTTNRPVSIGGGGGGTINTNGNAMTISSAITGAGLLTKNGAGTLTLSGTSPTFTGGTNIDGGTLRVSSVSGAENVTGVGTGLININNGGTFHIDNVNMGTSTAVNAASLIMNTGSTLLASGTASYGKSGGFQVAVGAGTVNVNTVNASDTFTFKNSLRRFAAGGGDSGATIRVGGLGRVLIESGPVSANTTYSGSWDVASGILQLGPVDPAGFGEALNGPGFKDSDPKLGNTITVSGGTLAGAVNTPNPNSSAAGTTPNYFRANVVMSGGKVASVGLDAAYGGDFTTTAATTSTVLVEDAVTPGIARNVNLVAGAAGANNNAAATHWNGTLVVSPGSLGTGGAFNINRDGGTVTVTPGAVIQVNPGATLNLDGALDALSDGTNHVDVLNNSTTTFHVKSGVKNVGGISGVGNTLVDAGATLIARHVRQNNVTVNGTVQIRESGGGTPAGASKVNSVAIGGAARFDLKDNKLVTNTAPGTTTAFIYNGLQGEVQRAYNFQSWDQPGLTTSMPAAQTGLTTIGITTGAARAGLGPTDTDLFAGQTYTGASTLAMYTYAGDANLDGQIDGGDYGIIDNNVQIAGADGYYNGDFNYDGVIDGGDYGIIDNNIQAQGAPFPVSGSVSDSGLAGVTAVPEPASLSVIGLAAAGLFGRRRRRVAK